MIISHIFKLLKLGLENMKICSTNKYKANVFNNNDIVRK